MVTNRERDIPILVFGETVFAVVGGLVLWLVPFLQHWLLYVAWGPCLAVVTVWAYSSDRDMTSGVARPAIARGLIVGIAHLIAVSSVWWLVTEVLPDVYGRY